MARTLHYWSVTMRRNENIGGCCSRMTQTQGNTDAEYKFRRVSHGFNSPKRSVLIVK